jgi:hypothetical protein
VDVLIGEHFVAYFEIEIWHSSTLIGKHRGNPIRLDVRKWFLLGIEEKPNSS